MPRKFILLILAVLVAFGVGFTISRQHSTTPPQSNTIASTSSSTGKTVDLSGQQLTTLPESVLSQTDITVLNVSNNQLTTLPAGIERLSKLEVLNVENNRLTSFPTELSKLTALRQLLANNNRLESVSGQLETMTWLQALDLSGNNIPADQRVMLQNKLSSTQVKF